MATEDMELEFMRVKDVAAKLGLSISKVWRLAREDAGFPQPKKLTDPKATVWVRSEVNDWQRRWLEGKL